jgi:hypothetical protein
MIDYAHHWTQSYIEGKTQRSFSVGSYSSRRQHIYDKIFTTENADHDDSKFFVQHLLFSLYFAPHLKDSASADPGVARWQKFRLKSSKGAAEKKSWLKEFVAEFWLNFTKKWQKRGRRKFSKEIPYF